MDGVTLGGGIGVSAHGSHRVVTERTKAGMPEATIGYITDVGGTYLLARSPGQTGVHAGLTAGVFGAADAIHLGLADAYVPSERLDDLTAALEHSQVEEVLPQFTEALPEAPLVRDRNGSTTPTQLIPWRRFLSDFSPGAQATRLPPALGRRS